MLSSVHVGDERVGVELGDFPRGLSGAPRTLFHLVLARIGIRREMADVGDVHHVPHAVAVPLEHALQQILEQERAVVADVLIVVDGRTARVQADLHAGMQRLEGTKRPCEIVVEPKGIGHGHCIVANHSRRSKAETTDTSKSSSNRSSKFIADVGIERERSEQRREAVEFMLSHAWQCHSCAPEGARCDVPHEGLLHPDVRQYPAAHSRRLGAARFRDFSTGQSSRLGAFHFRSLGARRCTRASVGSSPSTPVT